MGCFADYMAISGPPEAGRTTLAFQLSSLIAEERGEEVALITDVEAAKEVRLIPASSRAPKFWELSALLSENKFSIKKTVDFLEEHSERIGKGPFLIDTDINGYESHDRSPTAGTRTMKFLSNGCRLVVDTDEHLDPQHSAIGFSAGWTTLIWVILPTREHLEITHRMLDQWSELKTQSPDVKTQWALRVVRTSMLESMKIIVNGFDDAAMLPRDMIERSFEPYGKIIRHFIPAQTRDRIYSADGHLELDESRREALRRLLERAI